MILPILWNVPAGLADIYRWQDEQGHWHYTDSPPSNVDTEQITRSTQPQPSRSNAPQPNESATSPLAPPLPQPSDSKAGLFWRISKTGGRPSYLLGTIHSTDPRVTRLRPEVESALDTTDRFVMEMVMDSSALLQFGTSIMLTDGSDLEALLGQSLFSRVASAMADYGMPDMVVRQMKPWAVMAMLSMPKPTGGVILDMVLHQRAQSQGKTTSGLESAQEQLAVFENLPLGDQIELLKMTLDQLQSLPTMFEQLIQAYLADDLGRIATLAQQYKTQQNTQSLKRFMFKLNDERNRRMLQRTMPYLDQGNSFIAVGALHLAGPSGLVSLLRNEGYLLEPVR